MRLLPKCADFLTKRFISSVFTLSSCIKNYLLLVLKKFLFQPVMKMIADRQQEIDDMYTAAGMAKTEAQRMEQEYRLKLDAAVQTGERMVKEAVVRGTRREEEIIAQANAEADAIRAKANADIAQEKKKAVNDAKNEISDLALAIAGKVVGRELTDADRSRLVDSFIDELGDGV